jgi:hypothetical protein
MLNADVEDFADCNFQEPGLGMKFVIACVCVVHLDVRQRHAYITCSTTALAQSSDHRFMELGTRCTLPRFYFLLVINYR